MKNNAPHNPGYHFCIYHQLKNFSIFLIIIPRQNTTTWSLGWMTVLPVTSIPSPLRISPPMVAPLGRPASLTAHLVIREPFLTVNSATSALAKSQTFYVGNICIQHHLIDMAGGNHFLLITVPISRLSAMLI